MVKLPKYVYMCVILFSIRPPSSILFACYTHLTGMISLSSSEEGLYGWLRHEPLPLLALHYI